MVCYLLTDNDKNLTMEVQVKPSDEKIHQDLLESGTIYLSGEINGEKAAEMGKAITWLNRSVTEDRKQEGILLYLNSSEGRTSAALDIYDIIRYSQIPVTGIVYHKAVSAAALILLACHRKVAMQNAIIQFLPVQGIEMSLKRIEGDLEKWLANARRMQDACTKIVAAHKECESLEEAWKFIKSRFSMNADDALARGFIDEVLYTAPPYLPFFKEQIKKRENRRFK